MRITRKEFLRRAAAGSLVATAGMPNWAQQIPGGPRPKVLVVFTPDRPIEWFQDAFPMRLTGLPWQSRSERLPVPGLDFQGILLPAFCAAAARKWPADFIPEPGYALEISQAAPPSFHTAAFPERLLDDKNIFKLLKRDGITAVVGLESFFIGDMDRPARYGGVKIQLDAAEGSVTKNHEELQYRAILSICLRMSIYEIAKSGFWGGGGTKPTHLGYPMYQSRDLFKASKEEGAFPNINGTRTQITQELTRRAPELVTFLRGVMETEMPEKMTKAMEAHLAISKERQPYYYTLPF